MIDQIETEVALSYSGSYTDDIVVKNLTIDGGGSGTKIVLGSRTSGISRAKMNKLYVPYSQRLSFVSSSLKSFTKIRNNEATDANETFFDSYLPPPVEIIKTDGYKFPRFNTFLSGANDFGRGALTSSADIFLGGRLQSDLTSSDGFSASSFVDAQWASAPWVFSSRYKNLQRNLESSIILSSPVVVTSGLSSSIPEQTLEQLGTIYFGTNDWINLSKANIRYAGYGDTVGDLTFDFNNAYFPQTAVFSTIELLTIGSGSEQQPIYFALGDGIAAYSNDGRYWTELVNNSFTSDLPNTLTGTLGDWDGSNSLEIKEVAYSVDTNEEFIKWMVACGEDGIIFQSTGSRTPEQAGWTKINTATLESQTGISTIDSINSIEFGGKYGRLSSGQVWSAVGDDGAVSGVIMVSSDGGETWTEPGTIITGSLPVTRLRSVRLLHNASDGNGTFLAAGWFGQVYRSPVELSDTAWAFSDTGFTTDLEDIATINGTQIAVIVGENSTIIRTDDEGVTWTTSDLDGSPANGSGSIDFVKIKTVRTTSSSIDFIALDSNGDQYISENQGNSFFSGFVSDVFTDKFNDLVATSISASGVVPSDETAYQDGPAFIVAVGNSNITHESDLLFMRLVDIQTFNSGTGDSEVNDAAFLPKGKYYDGFELYPGATPIKHIRPEFSDFIKCFYGTGDGFNFNLKGIGINGFNPTFPITESLKNINLFKKKSPSFRDYSFNFTSLVADETIRLYGPIIRGWNYGIQNGIPLKPKTIYRYGKYGQFRDKLEQRLVGKFITRTSKDGSAGKLTLTDAPVKINFVSGTLSHDRAKIYLTASNPDFNPTDSGQFDYEYRSGQPFFDDINLENFR